MPRNDSRGLAPKLLSGNPTSTSTRTRSTNARIDLCVWRCRDYFQDNLRFSIYTAQCTQMAPAFASTVTFQPPPPPPPPKIEGTDDGGTATRKQARRSSLLGLGQPLSRSGSFNRRPRTIRMARELLYKIGLIYQKHTHACPMLKNSKASMGRDCLGRQPGQVFKWFR